MSKADTEIFQDPLVSWLMVCSSGLKLWFALETIEEYVKMQLAEGLDGSSSDLQPR